MIDILLEGRNRYQNGRHARNKELNGLEGVIIHPDEPEDAIQVTDELPVIENHGVNGVSRRTAFVIDHAHGILAEFNDFDDIVVVTATVVFIPTEKA